MRRAVGATAIAALMWLAGGAQAGAVPKPFEPLRVRPEARAIEVGLWGRSYRFAAGPLPSEVHSQGGALFTAPPRFRVTGESGEQEVTWLPPALVEARPEVVRLRSVGTTPAGLRLEAETRIEYDGMVAVQLELAAPQSVRVRRLAYEIALVSDAMEFFARHLPYDYQVGRVDKGQLLEAAGQLPPRLALRFTPSLALGDRRVGIEWWSETNAHWSEPPGAQPFEVVRDGAVTRLRVTPISAPLALGPGAPWRDAFALFVFPSRPPPERWRSVRFLPYTRAASFDSNVGTRFVSLAMQDGLHARYDGLPGSIDDAFQRERRAELRRLGVGYMPYGMLTLAPILHPRTLSQLAEWSADGKWWRLQPGFDNKVIERNHPELGPGAPYSYPICAARADYFDWMLAENLAAFRAEKLDAIYFDHGGITRMCVRNPILAGRDAKESWEYGNVRAFYKRLYEQMKAERPDALLVIHTHGAPKAVGAFVDFHMVGEALIEVFGGGRPSSDYFQNPAHYEPDYLALPEGHLDALLFPRVGGVTSVIPQIKYASDPQRPERVRGFQRAFQAVVLSNDAHAPLWSSDPGTVDEIHRALDRFGDLGRADVHPWWSNDASIRRPAELRATAWVRDGRALLLLANLGSTGVSARVELDRQALGVPDVERLRDLERPETRAMALERGGFAVTVPARDLRILALE